MQKSLYFAFFSFFISFFSCTLINPPTGVPALIDIDTIKLSANSAQYGVSSTYFTDSWVTIDNQFIGVFPIHSTFPVLLNDGSHTISILAGIKINGIAASRTAYPFLASYQAKINLTQTQTTKVIPTVNYITNLKPLWVEGFESMISIVDTFKASDAKISVIPVDSSNGTSTLNQKYVGHIHFNSSNSCFYGVYAKTPFAASLFTDYDNIFIELNYKNTMPFTVGIVQDTSGSLGSFIPILTMNPKSEWNKIYVNMKFAVNDNYTLFHHYRIAFYAIKPDGDQSVQDIYLDNILYLSTKNE